ncbi:MAG: class I SAM-dependent methyltransferase [Bacteroidetes bacterium]|nr:class I SAM-dependent methyltransferase [Bacteroidota bacterium]
MDSNKETFDTWNNIASIYQEKFMDMDLYNDTYDHVCNSIDKPNAKLLEIGCGPGNITKYLLSKRADFDIFGIDIAPNMIELAKRNNPSANFAVMDCRQINQLDTRFDGIIAGFCLPYLTQTETTGFISNAHTLLNEKGLIYLSFVEGEPDQSTFKTGSGGRVFFNYHKLEDIITQLHQFHFNEPNLFKVKYPVSATESDIHTILTAKKKQTR